MLNKRENEITGKHISMIIPNHKQPVMNQNDGLHKYECKIGNQVFIVNESYVYQGGKEEGSIVILENEKKRAQSLETNY